VLAALPTMLTSDEPLAPMRTAEAFETLRDASDADLADTGTRPRIFLAALGDVVSATARLGFARALFEAGGFETHESAGLTDASAAAAGFEGSGATIACLCGPDAAYDTMAAAVASALRGAGAREVWLAGRPGESEAAWRAAGVGGFVFAGCDAVAALRAARAML
jgi:methylmalonyl-CoA mutase